MARKRNMATAMMTLPHALSQALQAHLPAEALEKLTAQDALEVGAALEQCARVIAAIIDRQKGATDGR